MWFQWAKVLWAKDGDKNSKFFHSRVTQRKRKISIQKIWAASGDWTSNHEEVEKCPIDYFQELFTSANLQHNVAATDSINKVTSSEMNAELSIEFKACQVQQTIKQMAPLKAPGPDGMSHLFYQHYWNLVGDDVCQSVLNFLNNASLPEHLNHTFITLIPKKKNPEYASKFRPISLYYVLYKIFSKVLANRLKRILPKIIIEPKVLLQKVDLSLIIFW